MDTANTTSSDTATTATSMDSKANPATETVVADSISTNPEAKLVYEHTESMYAGVALMKEGVKKGSDPAFKKLAGVYTIDYLTFPKITYEISSDSVSRIL